MKNILELLENSEKLYPDKTAVSDGKRDCYLQQV